MKKIIVYLFTLSVTVAGYGQIDTTRKPVDTTKKPTDTARSPIDSTQKMADTLTSVTLSDTVRVHADTTAIEVPVVQRTSNEDVGPVYRIKPAIDLPIIAVGTAFSIYGFGQIYNKPTTKEEYVNRLRVSDINGFDRWAALKYSEKADKNSDLLFYASMPLPFFLLADRKIRQDWGKFTLLYWETFAVTGIFYTGTAMLVDRYRPLVYNPNVPMSERTSGNARNSFLGGHPALVGTSTFFIAKVYSDYHPESKAKWVFWTFAVASTATTAYLRHKAGKHFPSDLIVGSVIGSLNGVLVPHFHKNKLLKKRNLTIYPYTTGQNHGMLARYRW